MIRRRTGVLADEVVHEAEISVPSSEVPMLAAPVLGIEDEERAATLLRGVKGKRLLYRQPDEAQNA
jgi:hypothetical protein